MIRQRIIKYLDYKGVSKYKFYKDTGLSNGFLDKEGAIGSDKCEKISYQYPDLSLEWLITGYGEMLKNQIVKKNISEAAEPRAAYDADGWKAKYEALHDKYTELLEKHNELLTNKLEEIIKGKRAI